jgi:hypothetical protein
VPWPGERAQGRPLPESRFGRFRACLARQQGHQKLLLLFMPTALACARGRGHELLPFLLPTKEQRGGSLVLPVAMAAWLALQWHAACAIASFGEMILAFHLLLHIIKCSEVILICNIFTLAFRCANENQDIIRCLYNDRLGTQYQYQTAVIGNGERSN